MFIKDNNLNEKSFSFKSLNRLILVVKCQLKCNLQGNCIGNDHQILSF